MENNNKESETLKLLCSYNGVILPPRLPGGKLRYSGGLTRVLAVDRSVTFVELMVKIGEFCGFSAILRCQLPGGDLDTLVTIASDEDLASLIEEYDRISSSPAKIRAVLSPRKPVKIISPPLSQAQSVDCGRFSPARIEKSSLNLSSARFRSPCVLEERSARVSNNCHHHPNHGCQHQYQNRMVPRSYYWQ